VKVVGPLIIPCMACKLLSIDANKRFLANRNNKFLFFFASGFAPLRLRGRIFKLFSRSPAPMARVAVPLQVAPIPLA
jgi:hypothetical protein